jgi:hypothetical protein
MYILVVNILPFLDDLQADDDFGLYDYFLPCRDILDKSKMKIPDTWQELIEVAKQINGTDLNGDNESDYALCFDANPGGICFG